MRRYVLENGKKVGSDVIRVKMEAMLSSLRSVESMLFTLAVCDIDNLGEEHVCTVALSLSAKVRKNIDAFHNIHGTLIDGLEALDEEERPCSKS